MYRHAVDDAQARRPKELTGPPNVEVPHMWVGVTAKRQTAEKDLQASGKRDLVWKRNHEMPTVCEHFTHPAKRRLRVEEVLENLQGDDDFRCLSGPQKVFRRVALHVQSLDVEIQTPRLVDGYRRDIAATDLEPSVPKHVEAPAGATAELK